MGFRNRTCIGTPPPPCPVWFRRIPKAWIAALSKKSLRKNIASNIGTTVFALPPCVRTRMYPQPFLVFFGSQKTYLCVDRQIKKIQLWMNNTKTNNTNNLRPRGIITWLCVEEWEYPSIFSFTTPGNGNKFARVVETENMINMIWKI